MSFLEEVSQQEWAFRFQKPIPGLVSLGLLPADQDAKLSAMVPLPCLPVSCHDDNRQPLHLQTRPQ